MNNQDYFIQEYKINLNVRTVDQIYMGSAFINFSKIPENRFIILNCDDNILITAVRHKGKDIPYNYNHITHTLHIFCQEKVENENDTNDLNSNNNIGALDDKNSNNNQNNNNNSNDKNRYIVYIQFQNKINPDYQGFFYVDDMTVAIHLFPNFSFMFTPCDSFTGENSDINNQNKDNSSPKFSFKLTNFSTTITPSESTQIAICSIPSPQAVNFIQNRKMFKFGIIKMPLPYFSAVIGEYHKLEIEIITKNSSNTKLNTQIHFFLDNYIEEKYVNTIISFIKTIVTKIEESINLKPFSNCIQIADVSCYPQEQSNTAGLIIFTPETLIEFEHNKHFITKQIFKQFLNVFPQSVNENWIIEGLSSFLSLVILHDLETTETDIHSNMEIDQKYYQLNFFRTALNSDSTSQVSSLDDKIELIDEETLFDPLYTLKSTCLMRMLFADKTFEYAQNCFQKLRARIEKDEYLTIENFFDAFNCIQSEPFFESYFKNQGHPIVVLDDDLTLHQTRFSVSRNSQNFIWSIPLKIAVLTITEKSTEFEFEESEVVSILFDKKEMNIRDSLKSVNDENVHQKILIVNRNFEAFCRVWYRGSWLSKLCENAEKLAKTKFERDLFNVFLDTSALADLGFMDKKLLESFKMFKIPPNLQRRFPKMIGNSNLSEFR